MYMNTYWDSGANAGNPIGWVLYRSGAAHFRVSAVRGARPAVRVLACISQHLSQGHAKLNLGGLKRGQQEAGVQTVGNGSTCP